MIEFRLPELGEGIESGQVIEVLVAPGDRVSLEQPLLEVETDKAAVEIPSPTDGTVVDVLVSAGDTVAIDQVLVKIDGETRGRGNIRGHRPATRRKNRGTSCGGKTRREEKAPGRRKKTNPIAQNHAPRR